MSKDEKAIIDAQRKVVFNSANELKLDRACVIGDGIIKVEPNHHIDLSQLDISFFIPASGSGSRMFSFLYDFIETKELNSEAAIFFKNISKFPFFNELPDDLKNPSSLSEELKLARYILEDDGLMYGNLPKGLIPFFNYNDEELNPFQAHSMQVFNLLGEDASLHFTVQEEFIQDIKESIAELNLNLDLSFSVQNKNSDAYCFDEQEKCVAIDGDFLRRPSGHGALLENLNNIDSDIILIKNIDNVQPMEQAEQSQIAWDVCVSVLRDFKKELRLLHEGPTDEGMENLNSKYQLSNDILHPDDLKTIFSRPTRVCGMVINTGAPGGGPYWIKDGRLGSKQIVEKVQIAKDDKEIMSDSTHFNPVFIALDRTDVFGNSLDLNDFVDIEKMLIVEKTQKDLKIKYRELPGLWNGSMDNYNTIFVELPKSIFTPVKTVLDLIRD